MVLSQSKIYRKTTRLSGSNNKNQEFKNYRKRKSAKKLWEIKVNQNSFKHLKETKISWKIARGSFSEMIRLFAMLPK